LQFFQGTERLRRDKSKEELRRQKETGPEFKSKSNPPTADKNAKGKIVESPAKMTGG
jgi:hypothetical protein